MQFKQLKTSVAHRPMRRRYCTSSSSHGSSMPEATIARSSAGGAGALPGAAAAASASGKATSPARGAEHLRLQHPCPTEILLLLECMMQAVRTLQTCRNRSLLLPSAQPSNFFSVLEMDPHRPATHFGGNPLADATALKAPNDVTHVEKTCRPRSLQI